MHSPTAPEGDETRKALKRTLQHKRPNPHRRVLERIGYYVATRRIRADQALLNKWPPYAPPSCVDWDLHDELTVQLYGVNEWNVLDWFVQLVRKGDLAALSPADILALQEESRALQARGIPELTKHGAPVNEALSEGELMKLQSAIGKHASDFIRTGTFVFADFQPTILIERDTNDPRQLVDYEFLSPFHTNGLLYLFATLLRRVRLPIEQCPRCQNIFLKARRDAGYCSRECQSRAYAKLQRGDGPPKRRGRPKKALQSQTKTPTRKGTKQGKRG